MAIKTKPASQVEEVPTAVASMNPDNFLTGGLKDDFDGRVTKARLVPWDYDGNIDHYILAVALTVQPDDEDAPFIQHYSCGELEQFMPSMDGKTPVDTSSWDPRGEAGTEPVEGIYALRVGKKDQLNNNTNWAHFIGALLLAGFEKSNLGAAVTFMEGVYGHWNRIPQKKRSGIVVTTQQAGGRTRNTDILVITELKEVPKGATVKTATKSATPVAAAKSATKSATPAVNDLDDRLREIVTEAVLATGDAGLAKSKLPGIAIKAFTGADKARAVKRVTEIEFLGSSETWEFDVDEGKLLNV